VAVADEQPFLVLHPAVLAGVLHAGGVGPRRVVRELLGERLRQAAAGFGEAINAWFDVAVTLGPVLEGYAQSLSYLAQEHATNDLAQAERAGQLADRLGGGAR